MKCPYRFLFFSHVFVGIGAIGGGLAAILNPQEPLGVSAELLKNSPFPNYLIPGVILFTIIGLGNIFSTVTLYFKSKFQEYISSIFSWALVIWIIVQCIMINTIHFLHILYFFIGIFEVVLSTFILFEQNLYPTNLISNFYQKTKGINNK